MYEYYPNEYHIVHMNIYMIWMLYTQLSDKYINYVTPYTRTHHSTVCLLHGNERLVVVPIQTIK